MMPRIESEDLDAESVGMPEIGDDWMPSEADMENAREFARRAGPLVAEMFDAEPYEGS